MADLSFVRKKAYSVLVRHKFTKLSLDDLVQLADELGYLVVDYSKSSDSSNTDLLIHDLGLTSYAKTSNSFVYKNSDVKLIFLCDAMNSDEKTYSLAHELGHIYCGHLKDGAYCKTTNIDEEHEANEFAHYLLHPGVTCKAITVIFAHKIASLIILVALLCCVLAGPISKRVQMVRSYYGEYYVTETGYKYHTGSCSIINGKTNVHRLTIEEFESGKYKPCAICSPEGEE